MRNLLLSALTLVLLTPTLRSEEWPCWRGPRLDGTSLETRVPIRWSATENIAWKTPIPGLGHSSPILWGDHLFLTTCRLKEQQRCLLCLDRRTGKILWDRVVLTAPLEMKHKLNSYASSTPATDGERVFVTFFEKPYIRVVAYDFHGKEVWRKTPGEFHSRHGFCSSPILYKDLVIINADQDALAYIVALDRRTGEERWRIDRPNRTRSYCVPLLVEAAGKQQMVLSGSKCVASYDPDTGKQHWIIDGPTEQFVASPVYGQGLFFLTAGYPDYHNLAIRPDGQGNSTRSHVVWHENKVPARKAAYVPCPIAHERWFWVISDLGYLNCFEAQTGKRPYDPILLGRHHSASPVSANGLLYFIDDDGETYIVRASSKFDMVARNSLGEECYASPAISRGQIFVRTLRHLWCIGRSER